MNLGHSIGYAILGYAIFVLTVYTLAVMRLVRLINADTILDRPRLWIAGKAKDALLIAAESDAHGQTERARVFRSTARRWNTALYFVQCPWCVGMWVAFATAWIPLWFAENTVVRYIAIALAVSHLVGVFARFADTEEIEIQDDDDDQ